MPIITILFSALILPSCNKFSKVENDIDAAGFETKTEIKVRRIGKMAQVRL